MANRDYKLLINIKNYILNQIPDYKKEYGNENFHEFPLDEKIMIELNKLELRSEDDDFRIYYFLDDIKQIWGLIIDKSIKCLRYFDKREPFLENTTKYPLTYGVKDLCDYYEKYSEFESMLYGGSKYYRDHVIHVFRVWMLGLDCMLDKDGEYLKMLNIQKDVIINPLEKISIWSIIALTHDLGYPLEKSQDIIDKTREMMKTFVTNPILSLDLAFDGIQNNMNDFILRFISSKMHEVNTICPKENDEIGKVKSSKAYVARLQPKYYFKLQKSLEKCNHGVLSSIIIYKLLIYFLESDYNINEDYQFNEEDARQFYIRREILRSIASHTCHDIYHLDLLSFAYLLIIADDSQGWGRKGICELYIKPKSKYEFNGITFKFNKDKNKQGIAIHECLISEQFKFEDGSIEELKKILKSLKEQKDSYNEIFRDGQETYKRNFEFIKICDLIYEGNKRTTFEVEFKISNEERSNFVIKLKSDDIERTKEEFGFSFLEQIYSCKIKESQENLKNEIIYSMDNENDR